MNLDELKDTWNNDVNNNIPEVSLTEQSQLIQPLDFIRKNMRLELFCSVGTIFLIICLFILSVEDTKLFLYGASLMLVAILVSIYYLFHFKKLYNDFEVSNFSTFHSLVELKYKMNLFRHLYSSFYVSFIPIYLCYSILKHFFSSHTDNVLFVVEIFTFPLFLHFIGKWWFDYFYGKYIKQVSCLIHEIKHPFGESLNNIDTSKQKKSWFYNTEGYFISKSPNLGKFFNFIVWILFSIIFCFLIGIIVGFIRAYFDAH